MNWKKTRTGPDRNQWQPDCRLQFIQPEKFTSCSSPKSGKWVNCHRAGWDWSQPVFPQSFHANMQDSSFTPTTLNDTIAITNDEDYDQHSNTRAGDSEVGLASTTTTVPTPTQAWLLTNYCDHRPRSFQVINDADRNDTSTSDTNNSGPNESYNGHNDLDDMATTTSQQLWTGINKNNRANTNDYDR
ncbi:hypothetical protein EDB83DRAFT_2320561 [Lactarius deliciosus]|nr:hypothetical protein EDB83DRAFT_2320561 [Lactarius deliciosus]